jgi:hypothetical protein
MYPPDLERFIERGGVRTNRKEFLPPYRKSHDGLPKSAWAIWNIQIPELRSGNSSCHIGVEGVPLEGGCILSTQPVPHPRFSVELTLSTLWKRQRTSISKRLSILSSPR